MKPPVLIIEDDPLQQKLLVKLLENKLELNSAIASNGQEGLSYLEKDNGESVKMVITDMKMPIMDGLETLEIISQKYPQLPVIMITGNKDIDNAVRAMKLGAMDFITKPYEVERVAITVKNALKISILSREVSRLQKETKSETTFEDLVGFDGGLQKTVLMGRKAAAADIPVLITGETGVGKEIFSRAIHGESYRTGKPFIAVNCGAIPEQLAESILFGHEKGAFTGATEKTTGKFREADGGTIFLDEVGELSLDSQVKLLRVLQQKEIEPVGAGQSVPVNVRVVSATNKNLEQAVQTGSFREDLYFRLNVFQLKIPPLRERPEDIPYLARYFIERYCSLHSTLMCPISEQMDKKLAQHSWQGNVRELENVINRAMVMDEDNILDIDDFASIFGDVKGKSNTKGDHVDDHHLNLYNADGILKTMDILEQEIMTSVLKIHKSNVTQTSKALGIAKSTFYRKRNKPSSFH